MSTPDKSSEKSPSVTIDDVFTSSSDEEKSQLRFRPGFVSRHRKALDRIKTDSAASRRHQVPRRSDSMEEGVGANGRRATAWLRQSLINCTRTGDHFEREKSCTDWTETMLPMWRWLKEYKWKEDFSKDFAAGLTVGFMVVPQSMSYAKLAGLPVQYGLYSALVPVYGYALFGTSRQLAVGPVAIASLLLSAGLSDVMANLNISEADDPDQYEAVYTHLAIQVSFLVGVAYVAMGLLRLGFVTIFLSHAVVSGFTTGSSILIGMSQVKYLFGYTVPNSKTLQDNIRHLIEDIDKFNYKTFLFGSVCTMLLLGLKYIGKNFVRLKWVRAIGPVSVSIVSIILVVSFGLDDIPVVGNIPKGLPNFTASELLPVDHFKELIMVVVTIAIVGFMESVAIAKQLASRHKYEIDSSLELIGLGMANVLGGMTNAYPVTGSFCRSAVNNDSGAVSGISGIVTATLVMLVLLLLTSVFEKVPLCVLAAIIISGVSGLFNYDEAVLLWKVHRFDFTVWMVAFLGCLFLGVEIGLGIAVGISLLIVIYESAYPHTSVLGRLPGTTVYRNIKQYPECERYDGIVLMRIDAPLYFANAQNVREKIRKYRLAAESELAKRRGGDVKYLILEMGPVSHLDTTALHVLDDMNTNYRSRGQQLLFVNPNLVVMDRLERSGLVEKVGRDHFFACLHDAVNWALHEMDCNETSAHESEHGEQMKEDLDQIDGASEHET